MNHGILPHWLPDTLGNLAFYLKVAITVDASLGYLGFGVQEPHPSFGNMLASHFDSYMRGSWFVLVVIGGFLIVVASAPEACFRIFWSLEQNAEIEKNQTS